MQKTTVIWKTTESRHIEKSAVLYLKQFKDYLS